MSLQSGPSTGRQIQHNEYAIPDPRYERLPIRIYRESLDGERAHDHEEPRFSFRMARLALGVLECVEAPNSLPLSLNMDWLGYLNRNKGCVPNLNPL